MLVEFECPQCHGHVNERWSLTGSNLGIRLMFWHYLLNPGLAFNELLLGQRIPKVSYVCKSCTVPLADRSYIHCDNCGSFLNARIWAYKNAFGNWLGLPCPSCGATIPCYWNATSLILLTLTAPIWWVPLKLNKNKLNQKQYSRIKENQTAYLDAKSRTPKPISYKRMGWSFGIFMSVFFAIFQTATHEWSGLPGQQGNLFQTFFWQLLFDSFLWLPAGWLFGFIMKKMLDKKGDQDLHLQISPDGNIVSPAVLQNADFKPNETPNQPIDVQSSETPKQIEMQSTDDQVLPLKQVEALHVDGSHVAIDRENDG